jgi:hypothetical protein
VGNALSHTSARNLEGYLRNRHRSKRFLSLNDRLALYAKEIRQSAAILPPGTERDALLRKASQAVFPSTSDDQARPLGQIED